MARSAFVLVFCLMVLSACDSAELMDPDDSQAWRQFVVGDSWIMSRTDSLYFGSVQHRVDTLSVLESRVIEGESWFLIDSPVENPLGDLSGGRPWFTVRENGVWRRSISEQSALPAQIFLPDSLPDGEETQRDSGLRITVVPETEEVILASGESVEATSFLLTATDAYRPLYNATGSSEQYQAYPVEGEISFVDKFSSTHGFVRISGIWISANTDTERLMHVGDYHLDLIQFIPGN